MVVASMWLRRMSLMQTFALLRVSLQPDLSAPPCTDDLARHGSYYGHALSSAFSLLLAEVYSTSTVDNC